MTRNQLLIPLTNWTNAVKRDQCYVLTFLHVNLKSHINWLKCLMSEWLKVSNDICFKGSNRNASLSKNTAPDGRNITQNSAQNSARFSLKKALKYLQGHCYFKLGNRFFKKVIGITMGSYTAPFMDNMFLYYYEHKYSRKVRKADLDRAT